MAMHRCTDAECPYFQQPTTKGCLCHKTDEQVLREQTVMVPIEPTEAMLTEGWDNSPVDWTDAPNNYRDGKEALAYIYRAMLAVAPPAFAAAPLPVGKKSGLRAPSGSRSYRAGSTAPPALASQDGRE